MGVGLGILLCYLAVELVLGFDGLLDLGNCGVLRILI